jgi:hypothetical protein
MQFLLICLVTGMVVAIPVWMLWQRFGTRRGLDGVKRFDPREAVPCTLEPVALSAQLVREVARREEARR